MKPIEVGDPVEALYGDGEYYLAEITKINKVTYDIRWFDGDEKKNRVRHDEVRQLNIVHTSVHRFGIGDEVIVFCYNDVWAFANISAQCWYGYHLTWTEGGGEGRALERDVVARPAPDDRRPRFPIGTAVLAHDPEYEDAAWWAGTVRTVHPDGYEVEWGDGDRSRLASTHVIPHPTPARAAPLKSRPQTDEVDERTGTDPQVGNARGPDPGADGETQALHSYLGKRVAAGDWAEKRQDLDWCPACKNGHTARSFVDEKTDLTVFICENARIVLEFREGKEAWTLWGYGDFMSAHPFVGIRPKSLLRKIRKFASSLEEVRIPFIIDYKRQVDRE